MLSAMLVLPALLLGLLPPVVMKAPVVVSVQEGGNITLICDKNALCGDCDKWVRGDCNTVTNNLLTCDGTRSMKICLDQNNLKMFNLKPADNDTYTCVKNNNCKRGHTISYKLNVVNGCIMDTFNGVAFTMDYTNPIHSEGKDAIDCRKRCTASPTCQYFTFIKGNKCYLKSDQPMSITLKNNAISGYPIRNCTGNVQTVTSPDQHYTLVSEKKSWTEAQALCEMDYVGLAIIRTQADANQTALVPAEGVWIGLQKNKTTWQWSDGDDYMFVNWNSTGQDQTLACVYSSNVSHWVPMDCTAAKPFFCQNVTHSDGETQKVYKVISEPLNHLNAQTYCVTFGGNLASVTSQEEQDAFDNLNAGGWIGLNHSISGHWQWTSGEPVPLNKSWMNSSDSELCVKISRNPDNTTTWKADNCSSQNMFLCYGDPSILQNTTSEDDIYSGLHFINTFMKWFDALGHCISMGATLAHLTNSTVEDQVYSLLQRQGVTPDQGVWVGLERSIIGCDVPWEWTGMSPLNHSQWEGRMLEGCRSENCGKVTWNQTSQANLANQTLMLWAHYCDDSMPFICQDKV